MPEALLMTVVAVLLLAMLMPRYSPSRHSPRISCANNLKQLGISARLWVTDESVAFPFGLSTNEGGTKEFGAEVWRHFAALSNELAQPRVLACPDDKRRPASNFVSLHSNANISYFLNLDAQGDWLDGIFAGDRNLTTNGMAVRPGLLALNSNSVVGFTMEIHKDAGNVLFADGSVRQMSSGELRTNIQQAGVFTNQLAIP